MATTDVGMIAGEPDLLHVTVAFAPACHLEESASLMHGYGMPDRLDGWVVPQRRKALWIQPPVGFHRVPDAKKPNRARPADKGFEVGSLVVEARMIGGLRGIELGGQASPPALARDAGLRGLV